MMWIRMRMRHVEWRMIGAWDGVVVFFFFLLGLIPGSEVVWLWCF